MKTASSAKRPFFDVYPSVYPIVYPMMYPMMYPIVYPLNAIISIISQHESRRIH